MIYPPRPKSAIPPIELSYLEKTNRWCIQPKYNGKRAVILIDGDVKIYSRHQKEHKSCPDSIKKEILMLPGLKKGVKYCLDGELLPQKIILFDVLQAGKYLFLVNQIERLKILNQIYGNHKSKQVSISPTFFKDFKQYFDNIQDSDIEGVVLRRKDSVLDNFGEKEYLVNWLIRCRKPNKGYSF